MAARTKKPEAKPEAEPVFTPVAFTYAPAGGHFSPGLRPGDTVEAKTEQHQRQLAASPCFTPVRNESSTETPVGVDGGE